MQLISHTRPRTGLYWKNRTTNIKMLFGNRCPYNRNAQANFLCFIFSVIPMWCGWFLGFLISRYKWLYFRQWFFEIGSDFLLVVLLVFCPKNKYIKFAGFLNLPYIFFCLKIGSWLCAYFVRDCSCAMVYARLFVRDGLCVIFRVWWFVHAYFWKLHTRERYIKKNT